jgi:ELWxxDGT repeat protein
MLPECHQYSSTVRCRHRTITGPIFAASIRDLTTAGHVAFFSAENQSNGRELWKTDGTARNTTLFKDINPTGDSSPTAFVTSAGTLYFSAYDATHGRELWRSDGTPSGTQLVSDANPGPASSDPAALTLVNNTLFFTSLDSVHGRELWRAMEPPAERHLSAISPLAQVAPASRA